MTPWITTVLAEFLVAGCCAKNPETLIDDATWKLILEEKLALQCGVDSLAWLVPQFHRDGRLTRWGGHAPPRWPHAAT
jgi:hypothetical protein